MKRRLSYLLAGIAGAWCCGCGGGWHLQAQGQTPGEMQQQPDPRVVMWLAEQQAQALDAEAEQADADAAAARSEAAAARVVFAVVEGEVHSQGSAHRLRQDAEAGMAVRCEMAAKKVAEAELRAYVLRGMAVKARAAGRAAAQRAREDAMMLDIRKVVDLQGGCFYARW